MPKLDCDIASPFSPRMECTAAADSAHSSASQLGGEFSSNKTWVLKRVHFLQSAPVEVTEDLLRRGRELKLAPRQLLFEAHDQGDAVYVLESGRIKLSRFDDRGREITLAILERGEFFGEEALQEGQVRDATAVALERSVVRRIPRHDFEEALLEHPALALEVARELGRRWLGAKHRLQALAFDGVAERLARILIALAEVHGEHQPDGTTRLGLRLTHQELASLVVATRETLSKTLAEFRREGLVTTTDRWISLPDLGALRARAGDAK
jgi:CRP/FNR family transcriptional regulator, cyclic AMP receptor protein